MVEQAMAQKNPEEMLFYEKSSGFVTTQRLQTANPLKNHLNVPIHYALKMSQNKQFQNEIAIANTD